jgi:hypothetical protein
MDGFKNFCKLPEHGGCFAVSDKKVTNSEKRIINSS